MRKRLLTAAVASLAIAPAAAVPATAGRALPSIRTFEDPVAVSLG